MAKQPRKIAEKQTETKVTRIKASEPARDTKKTTIKTKKPSAVKAPVITADDETSKKRNPFKAIKDYFVGAWRELRQVRWPDRKATWGMTVALLLFTVFFVVVILLLDTLFKYIFQLIIG